MPPYGEPNCGNAWTLCGRRRRGSSHSGIFPPALVKDLAARGLVVKLGHAPAKILPARQEDTILHITRQDSSGTYFALIGQGDFGVPAREVPMPAQSLSQVEAEARRIEEELTDLHAKLAALISAKDSLAAHADELGDFQQFVQARESMGSNRELSYLRGFAPADRTDDLRAAAAREGWALLIQDPNPDDSVPTLVRNPPWIRPIELLFKLIGITPGYAEADISMAFLFFYSIFFAMLVGDAGYGLLFLALTAVLRFAVPGIPRDLPRLLGVLSVCTIAWGALTGTYFGIATLHPVLEQLRIPWLMNDRNMMHLCFLLGAVHLTVAHLWNAARSMNSTVALAQLGWIAMTWTMYFAACGMILDFPMPPYLLWLFLTGLFSIVAFMTPLRALKRDWPYHIMLPLTIINNFGDVVSYVRLFAVGSAAVAISTAFNDMAVGDGIHSFGAGVTAALILFAAHGLNILLCALGVIVHGVRLNTLEFCGHMGIQWTGHLYRPFARGSRTE